MRPDLIEVITALRRQLEEQRVHMEAWYKVFGTSQLTHAQATMEAKDAEIALLKRQMDDQITILTGPHKFFESNYDWAIRIIEKAKQATMRGDSLSLGRK